MNFKLRLLALLLVVMTFLSSCSSTVEQIMQMIPGLGTTTTEATTTTTTQKVEEPKFDRAASSMTKKELEELYTLTQEEIDAAMALIDDMVAGALPDPEGDPNVAVMTMEEWDVLYEQFEDAFYHIAQQMTIASIIYYCNMSDEVASERHLDTQEKFYDIQDAYNIALRELYLNSPMKDELFEGWTDQEIQDMLQYDPAIMEVKKEVEELQVEFDNLPDDGYFKDASVELYKQIVIKNNKIAALNKYDNYYTYASKNVYGRDYDAEKLALFRQYVIEYIVPQFEGIYDDFYAWRDLSESRQETFIDFVDGRFDASKKNYLMRYLNSLEGSMGEGMRDVFESQNCVFSNNSNSHPTAFQTYMYEDEKPFCLFGRNGQSANTIVHEIGHYYAAYTNKDINNYDLCETHSQGNEFLFIKFCEDQMSGAIYDCVRAYNVLNAAYVMILATIVDEFEQRVYALSDEEIAAMTSEDFDAIMANVCEPYGGIDWVSDNISDPCDYWRQVAISNPVYYISYAVSAVAAVEIFAIAEEDYDAALATYTSLVVGIEEEDGFLGALAKAGLTTPFEEETYKKISGILRK